MPSKRITCDFYKCEVRSSRPDLPEITVESIFSELADICESETANAVREIQSVEYEVRAVSKTEYGYEGTALKYRKADLPHAAVPGGEEREIDLNDDEQLLEKAHFTFHSDLGILILQRNVYAISAMRFGKYLTKNGYTVSLNPIIEGADLRRLLADDVHIRVAKFKIARPTNPDLFNDLEHNFNNSIIQSLGDSNAASINLVLRGDARSKKPESRYLDSKLKRAFLELNEKFDVMKAQLELEDDSGVGHPLDLITDRLFYDEVIDIQGRYATLAQMRSVLSNAREAKEAEIQAYFGAVAETRLQ